MSSSMTKREGGIGLESQAKNPPSKLPMTLSVAGKAIVGLPSRQGEATESGAGVRLAGAAQVDVVDVVLCLAEEGGHMLIVQGGNA